MLPLQAHKLVQDSHATLLHYSEAAPAQLPNTKLSDVADKLEKLKTQLAKLKKQ
jgi:hypothetical protein